MKLPDFHTNIKPAKILAILGFTLLLVFNYKSAKAQNTKGDRPASNRESRFRVSSKKPDKPKKVITKKRVKPSERSAASRGRSANVSRSPQGKERAARRIKPVYTESKPRSTQQPWKGDITGRRIRTKGTSSTDKARNIHPQTGRYVRKTVPDRQRPYGGPRGVRVSVPTRTPKTNNVYRMPNRFMVTQSKPQSTQRAWKGDVTGRRLRTKNYSSSARNQNVYPQRGPFVRSNAGARERAWRGSATGAPIRVRSRTGATKNVYPQYGRYVNNSSTKPRSDQRAISNRSTLARLNRLQGPAGDPPGKKKVRVVPRSASRSYISHRSINIYATFPRTKRKGEVATTKDLAGRPVRGRNYETPRPGVMAPSFNPYANRKRVGDRPYKGPAAGSYRSATRPGERAWRGDVAGRNIRHRDRSSKKRVEGLPILSRGYRTASRPGESRPGRPLPPKTPGIGAERIRKYLGNLSGKKTDKGGGSRSGFWNNDGNPIQGKMPGRGANKIEGLTTKIPFGRRTFIDQGEEYTGNIKTKRPAKGGGSVSGKLWNNNEQPIPARSPGEALRASRFQGNIKAKRPVKGGGSISGKLWNNNEQPIEVRGPRESLRASRFQGNIKAGKPQKGGGSISGKLWNNNETPIPVRTPPERARRAGDYQGNIKYNRKGDFQDQGEEFEGSIRLARFKKNYIQNRLAAEESIKKRRPHENASAAEGLQVKVKRRDYIENKNSAALALKKLSPTPATKATDNLYGKVARRPYVKNPNSAEGSLLKLKPTRSTEEAGELQVKVKAYRYIRNPSSADDALRVREPGKAFARATDYQGNIKMQKFSLLARNRNLHPDAQFVKTNKNNVASERDTLTNLKLWWARLFKKQETQPVHLKDKGRKPRYDKGEQGLWYD